VVQALVRPASAPESVEALRQAGAEIRTVDYGDAAGLRQACSGADCVVSALSGLREVIVGAQGALLDAAVAAGVPRFIPSDFCIDFAGLPEGSNRNLDLRREFRRRLEAAPIAATSILNGAFADMLTGQAPILLFRFRRVLYWHDADQRMDFTTIHDTAAYTAAAALDTHAPRTLRISGDQVSARELAGIAARVSGTDWTPFRAGGLRRLAVLIRVARTVAPGGNALYPPWQGMQYLHNMFGGRAILHPLDNGRYPELRFTGVREVLDAHLALERDTRAA
jgi:uncharacterized protein YbjT (DUF2867 family)